MVLVLVDIATVALLAGIVYTLVFVIPRSFTSGQTVSDAEAAAELADGYAEAVASLKETVGVFPGTRDELFSAVEDTLMNMRVPGALRDKHLEAVLVLGSMRRWITENSLDEVKEKISIVLDEL